MRQIRIYPFTILACEVLACESRHRAAKGRPQTEPRRIKTVDTRGTDMGSDVSTFERMAAVDPMIADT